MSQKGAFVGAGLAVLPDIIGIVYFFFLPREEFGALITGLGILTLLGFAIPHAIIGAVIGHFFQKSKMPQTKLAILYAASLLVPALPAVFFDLFLTRLFLFFLGFSLLYYLLLMMLLKCGREVCALFGAFAFLLVWAFKLPWCATTIHTTMGVILSSSKQWCDDLGQSLVYATAVLLIVTIIWLVCKRKMKVGK